MEGATTATPVEPREPPVHNGPTRRFAWLPLPREPYHAVLAPFVVSRLLLIGVTIAAALVRHRPPLDVWDQWDSKWYLGIASHGYHWRIHWHRYDESSLAFFPLYPLLVRVGMSIGLSGMVVALAISNIAFIGALFYVYRWAVLEWGQVAARRTVWLMALFPTAFFTFAPYTEALFLLCAAGALYHARRGQALTAGLWVAGAILTRPTGIILLPAVLILLHPGRWRTWLLGVGPSLCAAAGYLAYLFGQQIPLALLLKSQHGWHRALTYPWTGFSASIAWLLHHTAANPGMVAENVMEQIVTVLFLVLTVVAWRHLGRAAAVYCAGFWLLVLSSPEWLDGNFAPFSSMDRFILALFPLAGWAAARIPAHRFRVTLGAFGLLMLVSTGVHLAGGWVG